MVSSGPLRYCASDVNAISCSVFLDRAVRAQSSSLVSLMDLIRKGKCMQHKTDSFVALLLSKGIGARQVSMCFHHY